MIWATAVGVIFFLVSCASAQFTKCAPTCDNVTETGSLVVNPSNCLGYFVCLDVEGTGEFTLSAPQTCPEGYYFNRFRISPACDVISEANVDYCTGYCDPCQPSCSVQSSLRADPHRCDKYYLCLEEGSTLQLECSDPLRPWFDYQTEVCQSDPNKCYPFCDVCQSYCVEKELIFDPSDCHDYYACDPPYSVHYSCPVNHYFDSDLHSCAPGSCLSFPRCD